jgi:acyl dehydratase
MRANPSTNEGGPTAMLTLTGLEEVSEHVGKELGVSDWRLVTQEDIDEFARVTGDDQWIHVDVERARQTPFGGTIAHGYFTLSLAPRFSYDMFSFEGFAFGLNYGLNRVRFPAPLPVGAQFRGSARITEVKPVEGGVQVHVTATVEVRDQPKPALVAECVFRYYA